ncbi:tetratricopeptide repeat protein [Psychroserpens sp. SPM9]|uniref:tetratricopeptide repeat protein n=1 Tax=Psychroserpens sp. SPM9 TaxID=2975598 RepID=UPI0021A6857D|nr:tetratricopeptide repeat protein [Psychroserpens sp. SPM9]MDG5490881.1 tetratricopeptide repeat protein [Psychroserpens sp. SPM9]
MKQLIYIITLFISSLSLAQNEAIFDQANALYNEGNYEAALGKYNTILESGQHSAALYFNIANAHYRLNHIAPSIYYFEKALLLKPNDKEIKNNIVYARNMTIDDIDDIPEVGFSRLVTNTTNLMSFDNWAKTAIGMVVLFIVLFLIYYFSESTSKKRFAFVSSMLSILIAFLALGFAFHKYELVEKNQPAIVFAVETPIKSEPNLRSPESFKLHEGTKVQVLDTVSNWKRIELSDGKTGWISSDAIKMLKVF